jgi:hypothetical protein
MEQVATHSPPPRPAVGQYSSAPESSSSVASPACTPTSATPPAPDVATACVVRVWDRGRVMGRVRGRGRVRVRVRVRGRACGDRLCGIECRSSVQW